MSGYLHIVCPDCDEMNYVPANKPKGKATCTRCKEELPLTEAAMPPSESALKRKFIKHKVRHEMSGRAGHWPS
jgi:hypothetical protein